MPDDFAKNRKKKQLARSLSSKLRVREDSIKNNDSRFKGQYKYDEQAENRNYKASHRALVNNDYLTMNDNLGNRDNRNPDIVGRWRKSPNSDLKRPK